MKFRILLFAAGFLCMQGVAGQAPAWLWTRTGGGGGFIDSGTSMSIDQNGNIYVAGYYEDSDATFGSNLLTNAGGEDVFLVKYSPAGNVVWARSAGGTFNDRVNGIAIDAGGNVYLCGYFGSSTINFGGFTLLNANPGGATNDMFLCKYSPSGNVSWAVRTGGAADAEA